MTESFDFAAHLQRQREFSERTFGPGRRTAGVSDHIRKELKEIEAAPDDIEEWIDVVILALDGAWRAGATPQQIIDGIVAKQTKNEGRNWPDWRTADPGKAIEHDRGADAPKAENPLGEKIAAAKAAFERLTPEQQADHMRQQRESWVRGEMGIGNDADEAAARKMFDGLTKPFKLNKWIDDEVRRCAQKDLLFDEDTTFVSVDDAAEIARGAAVHVMTDQDTLIGNLRAAGYTVLSPGEQSDILKALVEHNDMLRSAHSVATRRGQQTNWSAFTSRVLEVLTTGHQASNLAREVTRAQIKGEPATFTA